MDVWRPCDTVETRGRVGCRIERRDGPTACSCRARTWRFSKRDAEQIAAIRARRLRAGGCDGGKPRARAHRHRLRSRRSRWRRASALTKAGVSGARGFDAVHRRVRRARTQPTARRAAAGHSARCDRSRRDGWLAQIRRGSKRAGASASTASANRRRPARLFKYFGFTVENVVSVVKGLLNKARLPAGYSRWRRSLWRRHDYQSWHQRIRPNRPHGVPRRGKGFPDIEIVGINDLLEPDYLAYMLRYDSVHGRFKGDDHGRRHYAGRQRQAHPAHRAKKILRN